MIRQLVRRLMDMTAIGQPEASLTVLTSDPIDLALYMEQAWEASRGPSASSDPSPGRKALLSLGDGGAFGPLAPSPGSRPWDHLIYSYVLENTRAVQIMSRVVRGYRLGESLGVPGPATQRWLDLTETLLSGISWPPRWSRSPSFIADAEATRRNAYWRLFGLDLAFGAEDNSPPLFHKADAANIEFVPAFEQLLREIGRALASGASGAQAHDAAIFGYAGAVGRMLRSRRQADNLAREELAAATLLGWIDLTLSFNSPVIENLGAEASGPAERLTLVGQRVGLPGHAKASSLFAMASDLSLLLRALEAGLVDTESAAAAFYDPGRPDSLARSSRRIITEWSAATGRSLQA